MIGLLTNEKMMVKLPPTLAFIIHGVLTIIFLVIVISQTSEGKILEGTKSHLSFEKMFGFLQLFTLEISAWPLANPTKGEA